MFDAATCVPGETLLWRGVVDGRVRWALPHTLVELTEERVAWLMRPGTEGVAPAAYGQGRRGYIDDIAAGTGRRRRTGGTRPVSSA